MINIIIKSILSSG